MADTVVVAAGTVLAQGREGNIKVLLVHRPRYDDWSFPKGKAEPGETPEQTAMRETWEETGFRCTLTAALPDVHYADRNGRPKIVHYWLATVDGGSFTKNDEVDAVEWMKPKKAAKHLSYARDAEVLKAAVAAASKIKP